LSKYTMNRELGDAVLEREISREMRERIVKNFLDVIVLTKLGGGNEALGGYDVIKLVNNKFGILISTGSAYAVLYSLERDGLIKGRSSRKRVYTLTNKGEEKIKTITKMKERILGLMVNIFI
jgi:DNA-binding PadR family transcriptional regulator